MRSMFGCCPKDLKNKIRKLYNNFKGDAFVDHFDIDYGDDCFDDYDIKDDFDLSYD